MTVLQVLYSISALGLALVGFNTLVLSILYLLYRNNKPTVPALQPDKALPSVLVQLPIYNERHVVDRLVDAVSMLDYPRDRLTVQLLDDSSDDTVNIASAATERAGALGLQIVHIRREERTGFKAGALAKGLTQSDAQFVAIFDADFVPEPDFLQRVIPYLLADEGLGMVQTRWAHINATVSPLTRAQALALDAHFVVEQTARHRANLLMNFSGTAGIWRRTCIESSGGWQHDTLSEDIDLSYRAQLGGWRFLYLPDVVAPAEVPPLMMGFKRQQARWATGTIQCLRKLGGRVARARLTLWQKLAAFLHLGGYLLHPLMILILVLTLPMLLLGQIDALPLTGLGLAMFGSPVQAVISQQYLYEDWKKRLAYFPVFMLIGVGIAVSNTAAVLRAFSGKQHIFRRTPKFQAQGQSAGWASSSYVLPTNPTTWIELVLAIYAGVAGVVSLWRQPALAPFMLLYALGFGYVALLSIRQAHAARIKRTKSSRSFGLTGGK